jgi:hypothetical protein
MLNYSAKNSIFNTKIMIIFPIWLPSMRVFEVEVNHANCNHNAHHANSHHRQVEPQVELHELIFYNGTILRKEIYPDNN